MRTFSFPGRYCDDLGEETIVWRIEESRCRQPPHVGPGYEVHTSIRGVPCWSYDFDSMEPVDVSHADRHRLSLSDTSGELTDCVLGGELPCSADTATGAIAVGINFELDLRRAALADARSPHNLSLFAALDGQVYRVDDDWFEGGLIRLDSLLPSPTRLRACITCLYSDYSPAGHGLTGMACHRDAKDQYLAVRSKADYWSVPITEEVIETYLCSEYRRRVPGTGYRG